MYYMKELFYFLSVIFILILAYIAYQDWKNKLIYLWSFYLLNFFWLVWYFYIWGYGKYILWVYFLLIIFLDILEYFDKKPSFISEDWMIAWTGVYDYWIYLFIISLFIDFLPKNFMYFYVSFSVSILFWFFIAYFFTKKRYDKHIPLFVYGFFIIWCMILSIVLFK